LFRRYLTPEETLVRVGLYFDMRNPPAWQQDPSRLYGFTLEMCQEAERLGIDSVWVSEHHRFDDGYLPQPLTMLAAIAARTTRVRLGTAVLVAPLHHPAEIAEQAALVDLLSDGRLDLGLGAGYRIPEYELYGADATRRYADTDGRAREVRRLWAEGGVTPLPVQERVPIWMGYQGPKGARRAGLLGEGLLALDPKLYPVYRDGLIEGGHDPARARMSGGMQSWVSEDPEADWPLVSRHVGYQIDSYLKHMVQGTDQPAPAPVDPDKLRRRDARQPLSYFHFGTPEEVAAKVRAYVADAPVDTAFFWGSLGGMPEKEVIKQIQLVCTRLAPLLRDDPPSEPAPEHVAASASVGEAR
jgi:alkanesulfonate monooxygenase SsuD/methylene tetrahydromethanopterin reductase-like flavin-dependent oxidoreductase (luciferase family)